MVLGQQGWHRVLDMKILNELKGLLVEPWHDIVVQDINRESAGVESDVCKLFIGVLTELR